MPSVLVHRDLPIAERLEGLLDSAILVNVTRGEIAEERALITVLERTENASTMAGRNKRSLEYRRKLHQRDNA